MNACQCSAVLFEWVNSVHRSVISTACECELQRDIDVLLCRATQRCPNIDICSFIKILFVAFVQQVRSAADV